VPAWTAYTLFTLAERTGWSMEYILWSVPIRLLNQGIHTYLYDNGVKVVRDSSASSEERTEMARLMGVEI